MRYGKSLRTAVHTATINFRMFVFIPHSGSPSFLRMLFVEGFGRTVPWWRKFSHPQLALVLTDGPGAQAL